MNRAMVLPLLLAWAFPPAFSRPVRAEPPAPRQPAADNKDLCSYLKDVDAKADVDCGAARALREEALTGKPVGGKWHIQKAQDFSRGLEDVLSQKNLNAVDRATAEALHDDLQQAIKIWGNRPHP